MMSKFIKLADVFSHDNAYRTAMITFAGALSNLVHSVSTMPN